MAVLWAWTVVGIPKVGCRGIAVSDGVSGGGNAVLCVVLGGTGKRGMIMSGPEATPVLSPDQKEGVSYVS